MNWNSMTAETVLPDISVTQVMALSNAAPIAVGGIGGSGTRLLAQLLSALDYDMGSDFNDSLDDLSFTALFKRLALWPLDSNLEALERALSVYLTARGCPTPGNISRVQQRARVETLIADIATTSQWRETGTLEDRVATLCEIKPPPSSWGWKEPNTYMVLPYLLHALPRLKYIHVLRDGRDMAFSSNKNQLRLWGHQLLGRTIDPDAPQDALDYWCAAHERLLILQQQHGSRMLLIKFESLVNDPEASLQNLLAFLGITTAEIPDKLLALIRRPDSITRYRDRPPLTITGTQSALLQKLGYPVEP